MSVKRVITQEEYLEKTYAKGNRRQKVGAVAPKTPEEYLLNISDASIAMRVGKVEGIGCRPGEFMGNVPVWLGEAPVITDFAYEKNCDVLVLGAGSSGSIVVLRLAELGVEVLCLEAQTWEEYDAFACDIASYNSKFFTDLGVPEYDLMEVYNEYMRKALGHAHPKLVRDYATRSGEMMDWVLSHIPEDFVKKYAHASNYKGNAGFVGEICGQKSFIGMLQWRDDESNFNMWPYGLRLLQNKAQELGARYIYGAQGIRVLQKEDGTVIGCVARDIDGNFFKVNCKTVVAATGDYGGNPDMRLDLCDTLRNLAWSVGLDRTEADSIFCGGRDGSGVRLCLWAGGRMEAGPRAGQEAQITERPVFAFGGCWPLFGPDGKRFENETIMKFGPDDALNMLAPGGIVATVTDANWDEYCDRQGYGHENMDRSNEWMMNVVRRDMDNYKVGPEGFDVQRFARYGDVYEKAFAANSIRELGTYMGYTGEALDNFVAEVDRWNAMCEAGYDSDWGCDKNYLFPIKDAPFFGTSIVTGGKPRGGLCQNNGVCTDGEYRVLDKNKAPIPGLYAIGNCCGQRFGVQYHTPTAGNCCGAAMTNGYVSAEYIAAALK